LDANTLSTIWFRIAEDLALPGAPRAELRGMPSRLAKSRHSNGSTASLKRFASLLLCFAAAVNDRFRTDIVEKVGVRLSETTCILVLPKHQRP
jgi:hypothetical protein